MQCLLHIHHFRLTSDLTLLRSYSFHCLEICSLLLSELWILSKMGPSLVLNVACGHNYALVKQFTHNFNIDSTNLKVNKQENSNELDYFADWLPLKPVGFQIPFFLTYAVLPWGEWNSSAICGTYLLSKFHFWYLVSWFWDYSLAQTMWILMGADFSVKTRSWVYIFTQRQVWGVHLARGPTITELKSDKEH